MDAALEKSGREVEDRSARFSGNQLLSKADNYLFVGILARFFFFFFFYKHVTQTGKRFGLRESKAGQRARVVER